jgi:hypothetical protein
LGKWFWQRMETRCYKPHEPFAPGETVRVRVGQGLSADSGEALAGGQFYFTISPAVPEETTLPIFYEAWGETLPWARPLAAGATAGITITDAVTLPSDFPLIEVLTPATRILELSPEDLVEERKYH